MAVLLFFLWIILNGRVTAEILIFGIVITAAVYVFLCRILRYPPETDLRLIRNAPVLFLYILNLILEILKAAAAVLSVIFSGEKKPEPVITEFDSGLQGDFLNVLLANSITLTPGTYTVFRDQDHFVIHCLRKEYAEGLADSSFVRLLRRIR